LEHSGEILYPVLRHSTRPGPWFVLGIGVVFQFWFMFEGPAIGQTHGFHLVIELCFSFGLCLRVQH
jgi:hypothetical protein